MTRDEKLKELHQQWAMGCRCELKKSATQPVFGDGSAESELVFIGEAPGKNEDLEGRPFVGAAGKFLAEMLGEIKMKREKIYITNIVKYRPPNNRDPEPQEIEDCKEWLWGELKLIKPKLIVFLGRHSLNHFFPLEKISQVHGKLLIRTLPSLGRQHFLALYHPAAALYNGSMREVLIKDFKKIPIILKNIS